jgi:hypothetical protein
MIQLHRRKQRHRRRAHDMHTTRDQQNKGSHWVSFSNHLSQELHFPHHAFTPSPSLIHNCIHALSLSLINTQHTHTHTHTHTHSPIRIYTHHSHKAPTKVTSLKTPHPTRYLSKITSLKIPLQVTTHAQIHPSQVTTLKDATQTKVTVRALFTPQRGSQPLNKDHHSTGHHTTCTYTFVEHRLQKGVALPADDLQRILSVLEQRTQHTHLRVIHRSVCTWLSGGCSKQVCAVHVGRVSFVVAR